jgi:hypothetical protein
MISYIGDVALNNRMTVNNYLRWCGRKHLWPILRNSYVIYVVELMKTMKSLKIAGFCAVIQKLECQNTKEEACHSAATFSNITEEEQDFSF